MRRVSDLSHRMLDCNGCWLCVYCMQGGWRLTGDGVVGGGGLASPISREAYTNDLITGVTNHYCDGNTKLGKRHIEELSGKDHVCGQSILGQKYVFHFVADTQ